MTTPGIRDLVQAISPPFLGGDVAPGDFHAGQRFMYSTNGLPADILVEKIDEGIYDRMPLRADPTALPYIGADRQIIRGLGESDASYDLRLQGAIDAWTHAGTDRGVMSNVIAYVGSGPMGRIVANGPTPQQWNTYVPNANLTQPPSPLQTALKFDWDSLSVILPRGWWRWWLILFAVSPNAFCGPGPKWGAGQKWGDKTISWGLNVPSSVMRTAQSLCKQWKRSGSSCEWMIVSFDTSLFDPAQPSDGTHNPAGTFGRWSRIVNNQYVASRFANARYCDGVQ